MADDSIDKLINPASLALVGASDDPTRIGGRVMRYLRESYQGTLIPVNARRDVVQGVPAIAKISDLSEPVDLAIVVAPPDSVVGIVAECADIGVGAVLVITSGFGEAGPSGHVRQAALQKIVDDSGIRLCGPNCLGVLNLNIGLRAVFATIDTMPQVLGNVALISQSGGMGVSIFDRAQNAGVGLSYMVSVGNESDITCAEVLGNFVRRDDIAVIGMFLEGIRRPDLLMEHARAALDLGKPIVVLKAGRTDGGARAAMNHSGALANADDVVDAAFERAGIIRVDNIAQFVDFLRFASARRLPDGRRAAVVTTSGGAGVLMADSAQEHGFDLPGPSPELAATLAPHMPEFASAANPFDVTAEVLTRKELFGAVLTAVAESGEYDALVASGVARSLGVEARDSVQRVFESIDIPFISFAPHLDVAEDLNRRGMCAVGDAEVIGNVLGGFAAYAHRRAEHLEFGTLPALAPAFTLEGVESATMGPGESARILGAIVDIPAQRIVETSDGAAARLLESASYPRPDGAEVSSPAAQQQVSRIIELVCGGFRDPSFGPVVTVGLGGALVEIVGERVLGLAPLSVRDARQLVARVAGGRLVGGRRGLTAAEMDKVAEMLHSIAAVMANDETVLRIDLNPVVVSAGQVIAVDAEVVVRRPNDG